MRTFALRLIPLTLAALPALASAQIAPPAAPPAPAPAQAPMGVDGGGMTLAQFQQRQLERIMAADTDGDGRVSQQELAAQMGSRGGGNGGGRGGMGGERMFEREDTNHDGYLDRNEIMASAAARFQRMDANGDGVVTPDERMAMRGGRGGGQNGQGGGFRRGRIGTPMQPGGQPPASSQPGNGQPQPGNGQ